MEDIKESLDAMMIEKHKEMCWFNRVNNEIKCLQSALEYQNKRVEYMYGQIVNIQDNDILNKFIEDRLKFDVSRLGWGGSSMSDIYLTYKRWSLDYFWDRKNFKKKVEISYPNNKSRQAQLLEEHDANHFTVSYDFLEEYLSQRFMPSKCGREEPLCTVFFGVTTISPTM